MKILLQGFKDRFEKAQEGISKLENEITEIMALAAVAQWIEPWAVNQWGHWFDSQSGHVPGLWAGPQ